jgi:hypothetical protein
MKLFFSGGLPKSGSNMIKNILSQNNKIAIYPYSPFVEVINNIKSDLFIKEIVKNRNVETFEQCVKTFLNQGLIGWAQGLNKEAVIYIDDNRNWLGNLENIENIFEGKMIIFIKDLKSIINSLENIYINKVDYSKTFSDNFYQYLPYNKQLQRVIKFFDVDFLKIPLIGINRIIEEKNIKNYHFTCYEHFIANPELELKKIYNFLNEKYFKHDLDNINISYDYPLNHIPYGKVRHFKKVEKQIDNKNNLDKESINYIETNFKWFYDYFYKT